MEKPEYDMNNSIQIIVWYIMRFHSSITSSMLHLWDKGIIRRNVTLHSHTLRLKLYFVLDVDSRKSNWGSFQCVFLKYDLNYLSFSKTLTALNPLLYMYCVYF